MPEEAVVATQPNSTPDAKAEPAKAPVTDKTETTNPPKDTPPGRRFKLKIGDEERELDESEVIERAQKYEGSEKRMREAAELRKQAAEERMQAAALRKQAKEELKGLIHDPFATLKGILAPHFGEEQADGHIRALAHKYMQAVQEEEQLPEPERKARAYERRVQQLEAQLKEAQKAKEEEAHSLEVQRHEKEFTQRLFGAIKQAGFAVGPDDKGLESLDSDDLEVIAKTLERAIEADYDLTPEEAVDTVKEKRLARRQKFLESLSPDEILGDETRAKTLNEILLRKAQEKLKSQGPIPKSTRQEGPIDKGRASEKKSLTEFFTNR